MHGKGNRYLKAIFGIVFAGFLVVAFLAANVEGAHRSKHAKGKKTKIERPGKPSNAKENLTVELVEDLSFGKVVPGNARKGVIVIDALTGKKLAQGGAMNLGGYHSRAEYIVRGKPNTRFVITLPKRVILKGKKGSLVLTRFTSSPRKVGRIGPNGETKVYVGAALRFRGKASAGRYSGFTDLFVDKI